MFVYSFKVALDYNKRIYRIIDILGNQTLDDFHGIIFHAFNRYDQHLYAFYITKTATKSLRARINATEYVHPSGLQDFFSFYPVKKKHDASKAKIGNLNLQIKDKFYYLFDFGDSWWHEITLESIRDTAYTKGYPRITKTSGDSPDQYPEIEDEFE